LDALDSMLRIAARAHKLDDGELRNGEAVAGNLDDQRRHDGEREWNLDGEGRSTVPYRFDIDEASDLIDVGAHHIHADAAAGDIGDLVRGRESRREDELLDLALGEVLGLRFRYQAVGNGFGLDPLDVEAASIVGNLDDDVATFVTGGKDDGATLGLAGGAALR